MSEAEYCLQVHADSRDWPEITGDPPAGVFLVLIARESEQAVSQTLLSAAIDKSGNFDPRRFATSSFRKDSSYVWEAGASEEGFRYAAPMLTHGFFLSF